MRYKELVKPYGRDLRQQIKWLQKKGFEERIIVKALSRILLYLKRGMVYANGHELDMRLKREAEWFVEREENPILNKTIIEFEGLLREKKIEEKVEEKREGFWKRLWMKFNEDI